MARECWVDLRVLGKLSGRDGWPSPVEGAALEMLYSRKAVLGSNPNPSANSNSALPLLGEPGIKQVEGARRRFRWASDARDDQGRVYLGVLTGVEVVGEDDAISGGRSA